MLKSALRNIGGVKTFMYLQYFKHFCCLLNLSNIGGVKTLCLLFACTSRNISCMLNFSNFFSFNLKISMYLLQNSKFAMSLKD